MKSSDILGWSVSTPRYLKDDSTGVMDMYFRESDKKYDGGKTYPIRLAIRTRTRKRTIVNEQYFEEFVAVEDASLICPAHGDGISLFATNSLMQKYERDEFWIARYARYEPSGPVLQNEANGFSFDINVSGDGFYIHNAGVGGSSPPITTISHKDFSHFT